MDVGADNLIKVMINFEKWDCIDRIDVASFPAIVPKYPYFCHLAWQRSGCSGPMKHPYAAIFKMKSGYHKTFKRNRIQILILLFLKCVSNKASE